MFVIPSLSNILRSDKKRCFIEIDCLTIIARAEVRSEVVKVNANGIARLNFRPSLDEEFLALAGCYSGVL